MDVNMRRLPDELNFIRNP